MDEEEIVEQLPLLLRGISIELLLQVVGVVVAVVAVASCWLLLLPFALPPACLGNL